MAEEGYFFEQPWAGVLQKHARDLLSNPNKETKGEIQTLGRDSRTIFLVEPPVAGIPAASETAGILTPGSASCTLLRRNANPNDANFEKLERVMNGTSQVQVVVFNPMKMVTLGSLVEPVHCHQDRWGALWSFSPAAGAASFSAIARTNTNITASTVDTGGVLTPGSGEVTLQYRDAADGNKVKDLYDTQPVPQPVVRTVFSSALQPIVKDNSRVLKIFQDVNGQLWVEPPDYGPEVMVEVYTPNAGFIQGATIDGSGDLSPASALAYLLTTKPGPGVGIERRKDGGGSDVPITIWNSHEFSITGTDLLPVHAVRDPDGHYWVVAQETVVFFDTYSGPLPAAATTTPGSAACRTYTFNGTLFSLTGETKTIYNLGPVIASGDTTVRMATVDNRGAPMHGVASGDLCAAIEDLPVIADNYIGTIEYLVGKDTSGDCYRVPVAACPAQLQHA